MIEVPIEMEVSTSYQPKTGSGSDLPDVTVDDNGKILRVVNGEWDKSYEVKELPQVTTQDDGKVLKVLNGNWTLSESSGGVSDYSELTNKPSINSTELVGDKSLSSLGIQETLVSGTNIKTINGKNVLGSGNIDVSGGDSDTGELSDDIKQVLLSCFENVAWVNENGQDYYNALEFALYPPDNITSISALFNQGQIVVYDTDSLDVLRPMLIVTAYYVDETSEIVTDYTLSGVLTVGTSTITIAYGGKTTTISVIVNSYASNIIHSYDFTQSLEDTIGGLTAELSATGATRDETGLHITSTYG